MKANVGSLDRTLRIVAGLAILGAGYYFKSWWGLIGFGPILTGGARPIVWPEMAILYVKRFWPNITSM